MTTATELNLLVRNLHLEYGTIVNVKDVSGLVTENLAVDSVIFMDGVGIIGVAFTDRHGLQATLPWTSIVAIVPQGASE